MEYAIQTIDKEECILLVDGTSHKLIPLAAIASWGDLLGIDDPGEVLTVITTFEDSPPDEDGNNFWTLPYEALKKNTDAMAKSGVPAEYMPDLLDPQLGAPVPGPSLLTEKGQVAAASQVKLGNRTLVGPQLPGVADTLDELRGRLRGDLADKLKAHRVKFLDNITPKVEMRRAHGQESADPAAVPAVAG